MPIPFHLMLDRVLRLDTRRAVIIPHGEWVEVVGEPGCLTVVACSDGVHFTDDGYEANANIDLGWCVVEKRQLPWPLCST